METDDNSGDLKINQLPSYEELTTKMETDDINGDLERSQLSSYEEMTAQMEWDDNSGDLEENQLSSYEEVTGEIESDGSGGDLESSQLSSYEEVTGERILTDATDADDQPKSRSLFTEASYAAVVEAAYKMAESLSKQLSNKTKATHDVNGLCNTDVHLDPDVQFICNRILDHVVEIYDSPLPEPDTQFFPFDSDTESNSSIESNSHSTNMHKAKNVTRSKNPRKKNHPEEFTESFDPLSLLELVLTDDRFSNLDLSSWLNKKSFDITRQPRLICEYAKPFSNFKENFLKGVKCAPDGLCFLTCSNDNCLRIFNTPEALYNKECDLKTINTEVVALCMQEPEMIYDFCWYPLMNSSDPSLCCLFSSCRQNPVHLFDAYTGEVRCCYKAFNHLEEPVAANSLSCHPFTGRLFCGYDSSIRIFDITRPGKDCQLIKTNDKGSSEPLPGIISCIAFNFVRQIYAVGSYARCVGMYDENNNSMIMATSSHAGGITHIAFSEDGNYLFSGARKDNEIQCWDLRRYDTVFHSFRRQVDTNQRIYFDLLKNVLASGGTDGLLKFWDVSEIGGNYSLETQSPVMEMHAHNDCTNGISFNPVMPLLLTSSGQRKFPPELPSSSESDSDVEKELRTSSIKRENSVKLWLI